MQTSLWGIANKAKSQPEYRFKNLYTMLNRTFLSETWHKLKKNVAYGVDRISTWEYQQNLLPNIDNLVDRLKRNGY